eukprot:CAMPEP_0179003012 /NCGR_PEP_ID=MMETSP0795-20121207/12401_1 /TAXON_ID=88552 /ORGANISM="Amoebophrya sp., Strain Ameob2" /LENGTH=348 /DNA_ID=CAMNT_0020696893 /DNA_START=420 /DNA_END=1466 /DNA_ORIENTATION=-
MLSRLAAASAVVPTVWCIDSSHLLRQETLSSISLNSHSVMSPSQPRHSVGAATLEAAGESTATWAPIQREDDQETNPAEARATSGRTQKNDDHVSRQNLAASNSTLKAIVELEEKKNSERLCLRSEFDGEQGPVTANGGVEHWHHPLTHPEDQSTDMQDPGSACSMVEQGTLATPGWWFVKFADGNLHHVSKIRLWDRSDQYPQQARLNNACVRFTITAAMKPRNIEPSEYCDLNLPMISSDTGPGSGTEVVIDKPISGMMLISNEPTREIQSMTICGIEIYEEVPPETDTEEQEQEQEQQEEKTVRTVGGFIGGAVLTLAGVGVAFAMGIIQCGGAPQPTDAAPGAY